MFLFDKALLNAHYSPYRKPYIRSSPNQTCNCHQTYWHERYTAEITALQLERDYWKGKYFLFSFLPSVKYATHTYFF